MILAVGSTGYYLKSNVDPRFNLCRYFILYDDESKKSRVLDNSVRIAAGDEGVMTAQILAKRGVNVVLTGDIAPQAVKVLEAAGLSVFTVISGTVKQAIGKYLTCELSPLNI